MGDRTAGLQRASPHGDTQKTGRSSTGELEKAQRSGLTPVVITHDAPSPKCIRPWSKASRLNPGFASVLDAFIMQHQPERCIHGHMHDPVDERLGETRIVANPHGYSRVEGHNFDPGLVIDL